MTGMHVLNVQVNRLCTIFFLFCIAMEALQGTPMAAENGTGFCFFARYMIDN